MLTTRFLKHSAIAVGLAALLSFSQGAAMAAEFTVSSPQISESGFIANEQVFAGFGCEGENVSPALNWSNLPEGTKSITVTAYDPDAPTGSGWWHWVVANIPPSATGLAKGAGAADSTTLPAGALQVRTDFGVPGYGGPCPPAGDHAHRYFFNVHALSIEKLDINADVSPALVGFFLNFNTIEKATIMGLYRR